MDKAHLLYLQNRVAYARDQAAYKELYLYFHPSIYKLAGLIIPQESIVEEIVSDVMIRVWTMEHKLAYVNHLKTYLLTATRNTAINYLRKRGEENILSDDAWEQPISPAGIPDQQLITMELTEIIERTVQSLPRKCQLVYRLIKEDGLSYREARDILHLSQNTLETHMANALKKLRTVLDSYLLKKK